MGVLRAFGDGVSSTNSHIRTVGILFLANLLFAFLLLLPLAFLLNDSIGHSVVGENLASRFDLEFLVDFLNANDAALRTWYVALGYGALAYFLLSTFLTGAVIDTLHSPGRSAYLPRFFGGGGKFFWRFSRLIPFALASLAALIWLNGRLNGLLERTFGQTGMEREAFWAMRAKQLLMLILLMLLGAVLDTARIQSVILGSTRMSARFFAAVFFVLRHLSRVVLLYGAISLLSLGCFAVYLFAAHKILPSGSVLLLFLAQQMLMYVRSWWRVCTLAAQMSLVHTGTEGPSVSAFAAALGRTRRERIS